MGWHEGALWRYAWYGWPEGLALTDPRWLCGLPCRQALGMIKDDYGCMGVLGSEHDYRGDAWTSRNEVSPMPMRDEQTDACVL